jgi:hypothetical protein
MKLVKLIIVSSFFIQGIDAAVHPIKKVQKSIQKPQRRPHKDPHRHDAQIMAQNFVNILIQMFIASHKEHDKEARSQAITNALVSLANIFKLIIRTNNHEKRLNNEEELIALIYDQLMSEITLEECEIALNKRAKYLKTEKPSRS